MKRMLYVCLLFWLSVAFTVHAQTPANKGVITGRVVTADNQPLPDTQVTLSSRGGGGTPRSTVSDDEGQFSFADLAGGEYSLNVSAPGYVMQRPAATAFKPGDSATLTLVKGGVITGRVVNALGEPVVAVQVSAQMTRDNGRKVPDSVGLYSQPTDDRGVYRLYGLREGAYVLIANAPARFATLSAYEKETPTYHPSADREGAQEITVKLGDEVSGIDIRYRGERGHQITGKVTGALEAKSPAQTTARGGITVTLKRAGSAEIYFNLNPGETDFIFDPVPDGDYELSARQYETRENLAQTMPRRVLVKGADVSGLTLMLLPLGSLAGRVVLDAPAPELKCAPTTPVALEKGALFMFPTNAANTGVISARTDLNAKGEFVARALPAGAYFPRVGLPGTDWYLRALTLPNARGAAEPRANLALKPGEALTGVTVRLTLGAAGLTGRVVVADGAALPMLVRVYALPVETVAADDLTRYAEVPMQPSNGRFNFINLAPGRYRLYAEVMPDDALRRSPFTAWEPAARARLRRLAAAQPEVELKACDRLRDYEVRLAAEK